MKQEPLLLKKAEFNKRVCSYWLLSGTIILTVTIIGIPLLLLWIPLGMIFTQRYLSRMECLLTKKALKVKKGILVRVEKTIPLEKITDMGMVQGPIMRHYGLHTLTVETAGQSGPGALVALTGIQDATVFREAVLTQRDAVADKDFKTPPTETTPTVSNKDQLEVLKEIRDVLNRIEQKISK
ncbi:MAG: PH domain-containing protein [Verrucomicrobia bacterium]|jgi:putative membrane protein|nr:PH domain-containing protein [Verrucomicrobiota bacterium]